jgi:hypothetical protein
MYKKNGGVMNTPPEKALLPVSGQQFGCFSVRENVSQCAVESQAQLEQRGQLGTTQVFCTLLIILEHPAIDASGSGKLGL